MKSAAKTPSDSSTAQLYRDESARIRRQFEADGDGPAAARARSGLLDSVIAALYEEFFPSGLRGPADFCLASVGGYGRGLLFPHSDIDLLFLSEDGSTEVAVKEATSGLLRSLWDLRCRVGNTSRTLRESSRIHRDNLEFNMAVLDCRLLAGDARLFSRLREEAIPALVSRHGEELARSLAALARQRHAQHGNTIFHLEPNIKEAPGGLRDYELIHWLSKLGRPAPSNGNLGPAFEFLASARCFLHYARGRDDNQLSYELQEQAARAGVGERPSQAAAAVAVPQGGSASLDVPASPAEWMRCYFRHARAIHRMARASLEQAAGDSSSLYAAFQDWKSRVSNPDFSVVRGRVYLRRPALMNDPGLLLGLFEHMARHGLALSQEAERAVLEALASLAARLDKIAGLWPGFWRRVLELLVLPHAAQALRAMHELGVLVTLFPELAAIDALVVRDFFHHYTVDEHTLLTLQSLHALRNSKDERELKFAEILSEVEQPELLFLALLFHDAGKGLPGEEHVQGSLQAIWRVFPRLDLDATDRQTVLFLIEHHLDMSATLQRRDIFDPETVREFAAKVGTPERLKMLCLLTYADIRSVNPEALTPWKAEMLWQLYAATSSHLARNVDEDRLREAGPFLEGLPRRYLLSHTPEEIAEHEAMARRMAESPVELRVVRRRHFYELTVLAPDRPFLFASITGVLAAWGMNITKADAYANAAGTVLDTFRFVDTFRTLELNPTEIERFETSLTDVLAGAVSVESLMRGRLRSPAVASFKVKIPTQVRFDNSSSSHSTLMEFITWDRPGLLYRVSSTLAELGLNIEVALIDTEGQQVIDVFYLTCGGAKLDPQKQEVLREALLRQFQSNG